MGFINIDVDIDIDDYIDEVSDGVLLREIKRRNMHANSLFNRLDEETEFPIEINGMDDDIKKDILIKWLGENFKRLSITEFEQKFN